MQVSSHFYFCIYSASHAFLSFEKLRQTTSEMWLLSVWRWS